MSENVHLAERCPILYNPPRHTPNWSVPLQFPGERIFILAGGMSAVDLDPELLRGHGRIIAIKSWLYKAPWADVLYFADGPGKWFEAHKGNLNLFSGWEIITRAAGCNLPATGNRVIRRVRHNGKIALSTDPHFVAGFCSTGNAINLAYHLGGPGCTILLLGVDMQGDTWYPQPYRTRDPNFNIFISSIERMAKELEDKVRVINLSPISKLQCFEKGSLDQWI